MKNRGTDKIRKYVTRKKYTSRRKPDANHAVQTYKPKYLTENGWIKMILYSLAKMKGLYSAHWDKFNNMSSSRSTSRTTEDDADPPKAQSANIPDKLVMKPLEKMVGLTKYVAAGYDTGKRQALNIVKNALDFGTHSEILHKNGDFYRINSPFTSRQDLCASHNTSAWSSRTTIPRRSPLRHSSRASTKTTTSKVMKPINKRKITHAKSNSTVSSRKPFANHRDSLEKYKKLIKSKSKKLDRP